MKTEVTFTKRPKSGREGGGTLRYLDLNLDGWKADLGMTLGSLDNGRKPHGGYKGLMKHPMGVHSFQKGADYQQYLRQVRQAQEQEQRHSPTWALKVHSHITHSGESPLLSARLLSASKHETTNGRMGVGPEKDSPRTTRSATPSSSNKKAAAYYRPNSTHQYLTATELKDAADCQDVVKFGRPTRTTLLRARHRVSSASSNAYEARRQKEQRMKEIAKVSAFCSPEELTPEYSDSDDQSFYSFLLGARYNSAHCLDSKSLSRHGVYMPRNNPLGCFVITDNAGPAPDDSPRSDSGQVTSRPQTERQQRRPTTAPSYGRKTSTRAPRTPRSQRTSRQAWGDVTVSLHVSNGTRQTFTLHPKDSRGPRLPVVHGTSLAKLQRQQLKEAQPPPPPPADTTVPAAAAAADDPTEALGQPPPFPISARRDLSFPLPPTSSAVLPHNGLDTPDPPRPDPTSGDILDLPEPDENDATEAIEQVSKENRVTTRETEDEATQDHTTTDREGGEAGEKEEEEKGEEKATVSEQKKREEEEEEEEKTAARNPEAETQDDRTKGENLIPEEWPPPDARMKEEKEEKTKEGAGEEKEDVGVTVGMEEEKEREGQEKVAEDERAPADDVTEDVTESKETQELAGNDTSAEGEDNIKFFVTEEAENDVKADDPKTNFSSSYAVTGDSREDSTTPSNNTPPDNSAQAEEDNLSTTSSKKSHSKHVSFKIPPEDETDPDLTVDNDKNIDNDVEDDDSLGLNKAASGVEVSDSELDEPDQGQGQQQAPLRVVVTHIEKSMGAPAPRESEEGIAKDPRHGK